MLTGFIGFGIRSFFPSYLGHVPATAKCTLALRASSDATLETGTKPMGSIWKQLHFATVTTGISGRILHGIFGTTAVRPEAKSALPALQATDEACSVRNLNLAYSPEVVVHPPQKPASAG